MTTIACYNFNNALEGATVYDDAGAHNGSVVGTVPLVGGPIGNKARFFNGDVANYITILNHSDFAIDITKTIEIWFTSPPSNTDYRYLITKTITWGSDPTMQFHVSNTGILVAQIATNSANYIGATISIAVSTLYYAAFTFDRPAKKMILYVNGVPVAAGVEVGTYAGGDIDRPIKIGAGRDTVQYPFNNLIHALRWSNVVKTAKEIFDTYMAANVQET